MQNYPACKELTVLKQEGHDGPVTLNWVLKHLENLT